MLPVLQLGSISLRTPGLALLAGLWIALEVGSRRGHRYKLNVERLYVLGFVSVIVGAVGARLGFILLHLNLYTRITPWTRAMGAVFSLTAGTETLWVGLLLVVVVVALLVRRWKMPILKIADAYAPGITILSAGVSLANFLSGAAYGSASDLPWAITLWGERRHPTQIYLFLAAMITLVVVLRLQKPALSTGKRSGKAKKREKEQGKQESKHLPGFVAQIMAAMLSVAVLLVDPLHAAAASPVVGPGLRVWSLMALGVLLLVLAGFAVRAPKTALPSH